MSICLFTRICRTDALLLNWPGMSISKNSFEQRVSARIALFAPLWWLFRARLKQRQTDPFRHEFVLRHIYLLLNKGHGLSKVQKLWFFVWAFVLIVALSWNYLTCFGDILDVHMSEKHGTIFWEFRAIQVDNKWFFPINIVSALH